jgi:hypothetical protein
VEKAYPCLIGPVNDGRARLDINCHIIDLLGDLEGGLSWKSCHLDWVLRCVRNARNCLVGVDYSRQEKECSSNIEMQFIF